MTLPFKASPLALWARGRTILGRTSERRECCKSHDPLQLTYRELGEGRGVTQENRNDLKDPEKMNKGVRIGSFKSLKKGAAAPKPAAQGGKGVEQLERVSVARNLTSGGER